MDPGLRLACAGMTRGVGLGAWVMDNQLDFASASSQLLPFCRISISMASSTEKLPGFCRGGNS
jgi:hypothetical protein